MEDSGTRPLASALRSFKSGPPVALIVPSTKDVFDEAVRMGAAGLAQLVGGIGMPGLLSPTELIALLRSDLPRPDLIVLSDQLLSAADASVLVRSDDEDRYFCPLEAVLNAKYGYRLAIWSSAGYVEVPPGNQPARIFRQLACYLHDCEGLGKRWDMKELQAMRHPAERRRLVLRKIRLFRSAVLDAYRHAPDDLDGVAMLKSADAMEQKVIERIPV